MPQLLPSPWFFIFIMSWAVLLFIYKQKIINLPPHNNPLSTNPMTKPTKIWTWTWY